MTNYTVKRYFDDIEVAITIAKQRAKTASGTQLIYHTEEGFCVRSKFGGHKKPAEQPIIQVLFDGTIKRLDQEEAAK